VSAWEEHAACRWPGVDPEWFFPDRNGGARRAKAVCSGCPVRAECLRDAMETEKPGLRFGVRAGLSAYARDRLWRRVQGREAA
jgi:WhiB family redox-sensing transcriptional regulator